MREAEPVQLRGLLSHCHLLLSHCHLRSRAEDISVVFSTASWEGRADFSQADVHRQIAIVFKTPPYEDLEIVEPVTVNVFLQRLTDGVCSEPLPFTYLPRDHGNHGAAR